MRDEPKVTYHDTPENRQAILDICCQVGDISSQQLLSRSRERDICLSRALAAKILRERMHLTLKQVGAVLGLPKKPRHHSSILYLITMYNDLLWVKDEQAIWLWKAATMKLSTTMSHGARVLVYIPDADNGRLLKYLYDEDYRHEVIG